MISELVNCIRLQPTIYIIVNLIANWKIRNAFVMITFQTKVVRSRKVGRSTPDTQQLIRLIKWKRRISKMKQNSRSLFLIWSSIIMRRIWVCRISICNFLIFISYLRLWNSRRKHFLRHWICKIHSRIWEAWWLYGNWFERRKRISIAWLIREN